MDRATEAQVRYDMPGGAQGGGMRREVIQRVTVLAEEYSGEARTSAVSTHARCSNDDHNIDANNLGGEESRTGATFSHARCSNYVPVEPATAAKDTLGVIQLGDFDVTSVEPATATQALSAITGCSHRAAVPGDVIQPVTLDSNNFDG